MFGSPELDDDICLNGLPFDEPMSVFKRRQAELILNVGDKIKLPN